MGAYTYGDNVYFKKLNNTSNLHHNHFILNHMPDMYIPSRLKLMGEVFESLPNLFFDRMLKKWMNAHI